MRRRNLLISCILLVCVSLASAQERGGRGRGGFGGGFGPPGMGMGMNPALGLIGMPDVRQELGVREDQQKRLDDLIAESQEQMWATMGAVNFQELQELSQEDREKRLADVRKSSEETARKNEEKLGAILDARQLARLNELRLQREGIMALGRPDIAKSLGLTAEQTEKLRGLQQGGFGGPGFGGPGFGGPGGFGPPGGFVPPEERQRAENEALTVLTKQQQQKWAEMKGKEFAFAQGPGGFGPGGFGGRGGPGGFGPPGGQERKVVDQFDKNGDKRLNKEERVAAREFLKTNGGGRRGAFGGRGPGGPGGPGGGPGGGPPGPRGGFGRGTEPGKPGPKVSPADVQPVEDAALYDTKVLRTLFLEFEGNDWEEELADFNNTDVEVPATLTVDGKKYPNVGVHFRGMSSFGMVPAGSKRSLNLSLDFVDSKQRLNGYKTLNLLNAHEDASFMSTVLYSHIARQYIAAPKANFVKVVINGESWGVYANVQQFNKEFLEENFKTTKGTRWKVTGSPGGRSGLEYTGENVEDYKRRFAIKSEDTPKAWKALVALCKTLNETPADKLEAALEPLMDIDGLLWFLALDNTLINCDGYWIRSSDYSIYLDDKNKFHIIPHDMNEAFRPPMGPGMGRGPGGPGGFGGPGGGPGGFGPGGFEPGQGPPPGQGGAPGEGPGGQVAGPGGPGQRGPGGEPGGRGRGPGGRGPGGPGMAGGGGVTLDPLVGLDDPSKPLRSKVLAVPALKARYLQHVRTIADESLDWKKLGPIVAQYRKLIQKEVQADTRKLESYESFLQATANDATEGRGREFPLRAFADQRRKYLLSYPEIAKQAAQRSRR